LGKPCTLKRWIAEVAFLKSAL
jgi:hypothetical protein